MNRHQVLTGASNSGDHCFAVGSVEGVHFTAYGTGCDIVILASDFQRVQIIPGAIHGNIQVTCIDCCDDAGKIAASYGEKVCIFEPTPLLHHDSGHVDTSGSRNQKLDYQWYHTGTIITGSVITALTWNQDGTRLLTGGDLIQMWLSPEVDSQTSQPETAGGVEFFIEGGEEEAIPEWSCIWHVRPATAVYQIKFSPDGLLFASMGKNDRLVKIWYENKKVHQSLIRMDSMSPKKEELNYSFVYIAHPRAVTGLSWRKTSKYMPRGSVSNMLITSCRDNICRIWCETILPEDGLVDLHQLDPNKMKSPLFHTHRHKNRFMQRLHHARQTPEILENMSNGGSSNVKSKTNETQNVHPDTIHEDVQVLFAGQSHMHPRNVMSKRKHASPGPPSGQNTIPHLPSAQSEHDFHKFGVHPNSVAPGFHFHLAASINPDTDIPLLPAMNHNRRGSDLQFMVHWLNNKELHFTLEAEKILTEMNKKVGASGEEGETDTTDTHTTEDTGGDGEDGEDSGKMVNGVVEQQQPEETAKVNPRKSNYLAKSRNHLSTESEFSVTSQSSAGLSSVSHASDSTTSHDLNKQNPHDTLDRRIQFLLQDWHQGADMLFSIHPVDGSFLVWLVDWLDEYTPGAFRQAQISFSSRIPHALPVGDAMTMSTNLILYCNHNLLDIKAALKESESKTFDLDQKLGPSYTANAMGKNSPGQSTNTLMPNVLMISKHSNGSMNLWQISFAEGSRFSTVLSVAHASRASGHRFRTASAACHPVLPLLLTTSHHNIPDQDNSSLHSACNSFSSVSSSTPVRGTIPRCHMDNKSVDPGPGGFCSELILWRVDPVGPLSKSGGITELARINSPEASAFSNVAWLPTLLPSSTLGSFSNSPSALFVASDGTSLRIFQSVIDARTLLTELGSRNKSEVLDMSHSNSSSSGYVMNTPSTPPAARDQFNIISLQSTSRPGCIIELDTVTDAKQDWQHIQLIHVFQEQLVTGKKSGDYDAKGQTNVEALVDLQHVTIFEEHFFLIVLEKLSHGGSVLHMWRIVIASQGDDANLHYTPDTNFYQEPDDEGDEGHSSRSQTPDLTNQTDHSAPSSRLHITTSKVCTQMLDLPDGVHVNHTTASAGHLSSSSIYPACFAPYLISTSCTDGRVRFWKCLAKECEESAGGGGPRTLKYEWKEWEMMIQADDTSAIRVPGKPISVSCAYSGRVAVAYKMGGVKVHNDNPENKFVNLCVSIYECESTGGSEWNLEDTIELKNISLPDPKTSIDLSVIYNNDRFPGQDHEEHILLSPTQSAPAIIKTVSVPSMTTIQCIKRELTAKDSLSNVLRQKHLVALDWVSTEDGSHILTVGVGPKVLLYAAVSSELAQATKKDMKSKTRSTRTRGILQKSKSMTVQNFVEEIRWMKLRSIELSTADGLPPLPMHISWVRDGILVVGMDNEMHVYTQWRGPGEGMDALTENEEMDTRTLTEQSLKTVSSSSSLSVPKNFKHSFSTTSITLTASFPNIAMLAKEKDPGKRKDLIKGVKGDLTKSESLNSIHLIQDCGLFEASRLANPVLPQYHPKQLIELLNFGKIKRVKAILAHLVRCIAGSQMGSTAMFGAEESPQTRGRMFSHQRALSVAGPTSGSESAIPASEDTQLDYIEISSIPPLPLYALLAADKDIATYTNLDSSHKAQPGQTEADYSTLFAADSVDNEEELEDVFDTDEVFASSPKSRDRRRSSTQVQMNPNYFGPAQSRLLARHLTHTHLPGLSSLDQMYLLALADTVSNTRQDFSEKQAPDVAVRNTLAREQGGIDPSSTEGMDDCGLRYMLAARHHVYLMNTLPIRQRALLQKEGLSSNVLVWAFHSEAEEELLNGIPSMQKGEPVWTEMRQFGVGWWIHNINTLRKCIEKVAKTAFQAKKDPLDAALFYLAMKKKTLVWGLFRSVNDTKMVQFFKNNFSEDRWRKAALKNAFALLGRQRFHHAAAFFLLAGNIRDAIEVCLHKLDDIQLGLVIARLYESELDDAMPANLRRLLYEECLGYDQHGNGYDPSNVHPDPFIRSMAFWMMKDYSAALGTLLESSLGSSRREEDHKDDQMERYSSNPSVFNFYNYLRTHPLLVRQHLATTAADKCKTVLLSGFSRKTQASLEEKNVTYVDRITPLERRLYFTTAHTHFKSGCPALALEVLSKLPEVIDLDSDITKSRSADSVCSKSQISTGTLGDFDSNIKAQKASDFDWSQSSSTTTKQTVDAFDWSQPTMSSTINQTSDALDWSQPVMKFDDSELDFSLSKDESDGDLDDTDTKSDGEVENQDKLLKNQSMGTSEDVDGTLSSEESEVGDIMAQQLKFIACLKIMMEELSTLATGFEVDGGQLRFQLYVWLEREVEVLKKLCNYNQDLDFIIPKSGKGESATGNDGDQGGPGTLSTSDKPTLHELILAEKMDFEAKVHRLARRKKWLKANQQLLRTLLSYSVLHGSCGGGLASVRMELILLLQELHQKTQQQLLSPLPFPTTLPLLSASVASSKTVTADPIRHLQALTQDILHTVVDFSTPPVPNSMLNQVFVLRNLSAALSACIYQCLCDSDSFIVAMSDNVDVGMEGFASTGVVYKDSYLMAGAQRRHHTISSSDDDMPNSQPAKWPGVSSLRALLNREKDEDAPKLNILLSESLIAAYMSLLIHAVAMYDANILFRLVSHPFHEKMWPALFGGGVKKLIKVSTSSDMQSRASRVRDEVTKQRMKLHMKLLGHGNSSQKLKEDKPTYKEKFVPPEVSMISFFMTKPFVDSEEQGIEYDSAESAPSSDDEDEEEIIGARRRKNGDILWEEDESGLEELGSEEKEDDQEKRNDSAMNEHLDPNSYSWCLMRYAIIKYIRYTLLVFLPQIGIELPELPVCSPLMQAVLKTLEKWEELLQGRLDLFSGPPEDYIPGCFVESDVNGPAILKYKAMMEPLNTPFLSNHFSALPAKRLWHYLVKLEYLQDVFIRYIFKKKRRQHPEADSMPSDAEEAMSAAATRPPMKIIHKEQDIISTFCINQANLHCVSVATPKEVVEMDISGIMDPPAWLEDETEYDIEAIRCPSPSRLEPEEFLVIQTPMDRYGAMAYSSMTPSAPGVVPAPSQHPVPLMQSGRGAGVIKGLNIPGITNPHYSYYIVDRSRRLMRMLTRRQIGGVRRMGSHPHLPYYLTGSQDGSVRLWEWGHQQCIAVARQPGSFPKVTKVLFNAQGNKFGVSDSEGSMCLWQVGLGVNMNKPYLSLRCHNKTTSDFVFVGSSSLLATAGHSSDNKNVCLWDTLLPQRNALIHGFQCHTDGSPAVLYAPQHQVLISSGKKGEISIFDVRQRQLRHTFQAHESSVRCMAIDPTEEYFVTGSADGDIKVWGLTVHNLMHSFPNEHSKNSIFRNMGSGVTQLQMSVDNQMFSCGADGSMKVRKLPEKELIVNSLC